METIAEGAPAMVCVKTYMPHPGRERELEDALHEHYNNLKQAGLVGPSDYAVNESPLPPFHPPYSNRI